MNDLEGIEERIDWMKTAEMRGAFKEVVSRWKWCEENPHAAASVFLQVSYNGGSAADLIDSKRASEVGGR